MARVEDENKKLLLELKTMVKENNEMLHAIRGGQKKAVLFKVLKYTLIIAFAAITAYYVGPMLKSLLGTYQSIGSSSSDTSSLEDLQELQKFLNEN